MQNDISSPKGNENIRVRINSKNADVNPTISINLIFGYSYDGLKRIYSDVTIRKHEKRFDCAQMFLCVDEKSKKCAYNYSCIDKTKEIYSDLVKIGS